MRRAVLSGLIFCGLAAGLSAQADPDGYTTDEVTIAPAGVFIGGFAVLPNGNYAIFDGTSVIEREPDGDVVGPIFTPPSSVFGSFLEVDPTGTTLYFGESSFGDIWAIDIATSSASVVATTNFPFDMAFDSCGRAFISWSLGFGQDSFVSEVDLSTGVFVDAIQSTEASGGFTFTPDGSILYIRPDTSSHPPPPDSAALYRFAKSEIDDALMNGPVLDQSGEEISRFDSGYNVVRDGAGDLFISNSVADLIYQVDADSGETSIFYDHLVDFWSFSYLAFVPGTKGVFEPYQPGEGGTLIATHTDFFSFNEAVKLSPRRPTTTVDNGVPVPVGPFSIDFDGFVPDGQGFVLVGADTTSEIEIPNSSWAAPLCFGLTGSGLVLFSVSIDSDGQASLSAVNPGTGGAVLGVQVIAAESGGTSLYGTSAPLRIELD